MKEPASPPPPTQHHLTASGEAARDSCTRQGWEVDRALVKRGESAKTANQTQVQALLEYSSKTPRTAAHPRSDTRTEA